MRNSNYEHIRMANTDRTELRNALFAVDEITDLHGVAADEIYGNGFHEEDSDRNPSHCMQRTGFRIM